MTPPGTPTPFDAIILAGGAARRLGGASKPAVQLRGRTLLDHALDATMAAGTTVVVGPPELRVPTGVHQTLEDPPFGGPVAGIGAGLAKLTAAGAGVCADVVLILACDIPGAALAVPHLLRAITTTDADGVCPVDGTGHAQWLLGMYRRSALQAAFKRLGRTQEIRNTGVHKLLAGMVLTQVTVPEHATTDIDTWHDLDTHSQHNRN